MGLLLGIQIGEGLLNLGANSIFFPHFVFSKDQGRNPMIFYDIPSNLQQNKDMPYFSKEIY